MTFQDLYPINLCDQVLDYFFILPWIWHLLLTMRFFGFMYSGLFTTPAGGGANNTRSWSISTSRLTPAQRDTLGVVTPSGIIAVPIEEQWVM